MSLPDLSLRAGPDTAIAVRATPKARCNAVDNGDPLKIRVTAPPAEGKSHDAMRKLLAKALGVAPSLLLPIRGASSPDKVFCVD